MSVSVWLGLLQQQSKEGSAVFRGALELPEGAPIWLGDCLFLPRYGHGAGGVGNV